MRFVALLFVFALGCASDLPAADSCVIDMFEGGEVAKRSIEELDAEGRTISIVSWRLRARPVRMSLHVSFEYDAEGRIVAVERDMGSVVTRQDVTYDPDRIVVSETGWTNEYTLENGRIVLHTESGQLPPFWVRTARYSYDERGRVVALERQSVDGDRVSYRVLAFDPVDRPVAGVREESRDAASVAPSTHYIWSYADDGVTVTRTIDGRAAVGRFETDSTGRLLGAAVDDDADGIVEWFATWAYDDPSRTMSAMVVWSDPELESAQFVARGACPAPRLPERGIRVPQPLGAGQGRIELGIDGVDLLGF